MLDNFHLIIYLAIPGIFLQTCLSSEQSLTEEQKQDMLQQFLPIATKMVSEDFMKEELYLNRYLESSDFDLKTAIKMLKETVEWRRVNNMSTIIFEEFPASVDREFSFSLGDVFDKVGQPVAIIPFGKYNIRKYSIGHNMANLPRRFLLVLELIERYIYLKRIQGNNNKNITQAIGIFDLQGFNLVTSACLNCVSILPEVIPLLDTHYPRLGKKLYFINAPKYFDTIFAMVKRLLKKQTQEVLELYDYNRNTWLPVLLKDIPKENLPTSYGGLKKGFSKNNAQDEIIQHLKEEALLKKDAIEKVQKNGTGKIEIDVNEK